jgi:hypothetical protein
MGEVEMQFALMLVAAIIQSATLYYVYSMAKELARIRATLDALSRRPVGPVKGMSDRSSHSKLTRLFVIWAWKDDCWELDLASVPAGVEAGAPPSFRGSFEGHRVRKEPS